MNKAQKINHEFSERFEQAGGIVIDKMFWIAGCYESSDLKEVMEEMTIRDLTDIFPQASVKSLEDYGSGKQEFPAQPFIENDMWGFFAVLHYPHHYDFRYNAKGEFTGCSISGGSMTINYAYGEDIPELMEAIEKVAAVNFKVCQEADKKKMILKASLNNRKIKPQASR